MSSAQPEKHEDELIEALDETAALGEDGPPPSIAELVEKGDADALIELGAAHRAGTAFVKRDLVKAVECFEAAASLGHAEAEYLVGLARFSGLGVEKDQAEGATRLRSAAQKGSLRAKVYVANLYEMGVYYASDKEKADVWYRNVARAASLDATPDSDVYVMAMAEYGCVRYCLKLVADAALPAKERTFYLKKAKAMGYAQRLAQHKRESAVPEPPVASVEPKAAAPIEPKTEAPAPEPKKKEEPREEPSLAAQWTIGPGILAAVASTYFAAASSFAGFLVAIGVRTLASEGHPLPLVAQHPELTTLATMIALGIAPAAGLYRPRVVSIATLLAVVAGAAGWFLFDAQRLLWDRIAQTAAFGWGAFLIALLILGVLGGTRKKPRAPKAKLPRASKAPV